MEGLILHISHPFTWNKVKDERWLLLKVQGRWRDVAVLLNLNFNLSAAGVQVKFTGDAVPLNLEV